MMKRYRRRFILSNLLLVGLVLVVIYIALIAFLYQSRRAELNDTMRLVLAPWNGQENNRALMGPFDFSGTQTAPTQEESGIDQSGIDTVIYDPRTSSVYYYSQKKSPDTDAILRAVLQAVEQKDSFGRLPASDLYYYRESAGEIYRIALADSALLTARLWREALGLFFVFLLAMGFFYCISLLLARRATRPLEEAIERERRFVANISHDLKTPLAIILANNSVLRAESEASVATQTAWIDSTDQAAKNMQKMLDEMLTLSLLEETGRTVEKAPFCISQCAEKCVLQMESVAFERKVSLESAITPNLFMLGSEEYTERILTALLENATKYEPAGGRVRLALTKEKKKIQMLVQNAGAVIDKEDLDHIFERFWRADKTRSQSVGHGLGLPIVQEMTRLVGGKIEVTSTSSEGTTFRLTFDAM